MVRMYFVLGNQKKKKQRCELVVQEELDQVEALGKSSAVCQEYVENKSFIHTWLLANLFV